MLDYAGERAREALRAARSAVLATSGPAGVQVSEVPCQALDLALYLLVPRTSDHLFNLEQVANVTLLTGGWELRGEARIVVDLDRADPDLGLLQQTGAEWCALVCVNPCRLQIRREGGWGNVETIDLRPA